jgi:hypothetical protein
MAAASIRSTAGVTYALRESSALAAKAGVNHAKDGLRWRLAAPAIDVLALG